ncbi:hypothetical protein [Chachezhania antarctica]|uniref:hypothetical protein n=1 Tax=Chachezhania antarctica TaxID=2340860 RepID=UPI000EB03D75|nr:hypothetical protein [Chachezhania antarctica]|tara:strand:- start:2725 stop:2919 length:195 start_codon:yes stop_codon:yes gene_type:complete
MSDQTDHGSGGDRFMAFVLGALLVVAMAAGYLAYTGGVPFAERPDLWTRMPGGIEVHGEVNSGS